MRLNNVKIKLRRSRHLRKNCLALTLYEEVSWTSIPGQIETPEEES